MGKMPKGLQVHQIKKYIADQTDIDPAQVDVQALVDPTLHFDENWGNIKAELGVVTQTKRGRERRQYESRRERKSGIEELLERDTPEGLLDRFTVQELHDMRSRKAQIADESKKAPKTTDEVKWVLNPNELDYPGVDTKKRKGKDSGSIVDKVLGGE